MAFLKHFGFITLIAFTVAAPQHYQTYYSHDGSEPSSEVNIKKGPSTALVYKQEISEHQNPIEYEYSYGSHDDSNHNVKNQPESRKENIEEEHYEHNNMPSALGYKQFIDYNTANNKMEYKTIVHHVPAKQQASSENKYFSLPSSSSYKEEEYTKKFVTATPSGGSSYHEQPILSYHEKPTISQSSVVYHDGSHQMNHHNHQQQTAAAAAGNSQYEINSYHNNDSPIKHHEIVDNSHYDTNSYNNESPMKHHQTSYEYNDAGSSVSENHHVPSAIYYKEIHNINAHDNNDHDDDDDDAQSIDEPKYILVKAEKPEDSMTYEHNKPKTIKYSSAHTSSHVSFNGPNASYHY